MHPLAGGDQPLCHVSYEACNSNRTKKCPQPGRGGQVKEINRGHCRPGPSSRPRTGSRTRRCLPIWKAAGRSRHRARVAAEAIEGDHPVLADKLRRAPLVVPHTCHWCRGVACATLTKRVSTCGRPPSTRLRSFCMMTRCNGRDCSSRPSGGGRMQSIHCTDYPEAARYARIRDGEFRACQRCSEPAPAHAAECTRQRRRQRSCCRLPLA